MYKLPYLFFVFVLFFAPVGTQVPGFSTTLEKFYSTG